MGVARADALYAAIGAVGVDAGTTAIAGGRRPLAVSGGLALIVLGVRILLDRHEKQKEVPGTTRTGLVWAYLSTLGLTITNPATVISFAALATTLGLGTGAGPVKPGLLGLGVRPGCAARGAPLV